MVKCDWSHCDRVATDNVRFLWSDIVTSECADHAQVTRNAMNYVVESGLMNQGTRNKLSFHHGYMG